MRYNYFWLFMYRAFKIRRPLPKDFLDFDELKSLGSIAKKELMKK